MSIYKTDDKSQLVQLIKKHSCSTSKKSINTTCWALHVRKQVNKITEKVLTDHFPNFV